MLTSKKLAFIGLGVMGAPMASHLAQAGYSVCVYNRTPSKSQAWAKEHDDCDPSASAAQAAKHADIVFICVGQDDDVREVITGNRGILTSLKPGSLVIDHTTTSAHLAKEMAFACNEKQVDFLDAPVSGGQQGAEQGQLSIMVGGAKPAFERAQPLMAHFARVITHMGASGSGQLTKMVNQICIGGLIQALAEGLNFAKQANLDVDKVIEVIGQGAAGSWQMQNRHASMLAGEYEHGFAVDWMRKDFSICLEQARSLGAPLPVTALVDQLYAEVQSLGGGRWDTSSLLKRLEALNSVGINNPEKPLN